MKFFFDANLSYRLANMLQALYDEDHEIVHITQHPLFQHDNRYSPQGRVSGNPTPDLEWIEGLTRTGEDWKVLTHDTNIFDTPHLRAAVGESGLTFFACDDRWDKLTKDQAWRLVQLWPEIVRYAREPRGSLFRLCFARKSSIERIEPGMRARGGRLRP